MLEERNFDLMDVSEDLLDDEVERDRPDSFYPLLENEGHRKWKINSILTLGPFRELNYF